MSGATPFEEGLARVRSALVPMRLLGSPVRASREVLARITSLPRVPVAESRAAAVPTAAPATLDELRAQAIVCTRCAHLVSFRKQVVFGTGNPRAELMFVGEAPGAEEDEQGEPFVGRAGQLLTKILVAMGLSRDAVYIANVLKCRPDVPPGQPGNRKPTPAEMATCLPWLRRQIEIVRPRVLVALGATAVQGLLDRDEPIGRLRGRWLEFEGIPLMPTYHPSFLLRGEKVSEKRRVWEDMLAVLEKLGHPISEKQRGYFSSAA